MKHTTETLKQEIVSYFVKNPRCIVSQYTLEEFDQLEARVQELKLLKLEEALKNTKVWKRRTKESEEIDGQPCWFRAFYPDDVLLVDSGIEAKVYIWTSKDDSEILEFSLELH